VPQVCLLYTSHPPQTFSAFNVYAEEQSILNANQSLVQQIVSSGLAAPGDTLAILGILLASGQVSSSLFSNGIALFGGGLTASALAPGAATANLNLNSVSYTHLDVYKRQVYEGPVPVEPEVVVEQDGPADWDEDEVRRQHAAEAEEIAASEQPGQVLDEETPDQPRAAAEGPQEVVLKIRRRKFQRTPQKGEIVITRRLFRTGESEYLLNGKLCRLRDIQDIFMGTGLGPESYAIIGQERIGQLLSSKPHDRRAIIEEAAGITRFKTKKRLAELRLESSKQNLARVDDIFEEVTRQMNSLKRQASKAERYAAARDELRRRLRVVLALSLIHI